MSCKYLSPLPDAGSIVARRDDRQLYLMVKGEMNVGFTCINRVDKEI